MTLYSIPRSGMQMSIIKHCDDVMEAPERTETDERLPKNFSFEELQHLLSYEFVHTLRNTYPTLFIWFFVSAEPLVVDLKNIWDGDRLPRRYTVRYYIRKLDMNVSR